MYCMYVQYVPQFPQYKYSATIVSTIIVSTWYTVPWYCKGHACDFSSEGYQSQAHLCHYQRKERLSLGDCVAAV